MQAKPISIGRMESQCETVANLLRALSHPHRLMILGHLTHGTKTVSELQDLCGTSQSQLSQFLNRMRLEGLVKCDREGRFQHYSIADKKVVKLISALQDIYC